MTICDHKEYNKNCKWCSDALSNFAYAIKNGYSVDEDLDPFVKKDWEEIKDYYKKCQDYEPNEEVDEK